MRFMSSLSLRTLLPGCGLLALAAFAPSASAQQATPPMGGMKHEMNEAEHHGTGWKELDAFHAAMEAGWHPAMMDSLAPARATAPTLVAAAKAFAKSPAPMGCESPAVKTAVQRLVPESEAVASLVTKMAADAQIKAALKTVHDTFHVVEEGCKPMKHDGGHEA